MYLSIYWSPNIALYNTHNAQQYLQEVWNRSARIGQEESAGHWIIFSKKSGRAPRYSQMDQQGELDNEYISSRSVWTLHNHGHPGPLTTNRKGNLVMMATFLCKSTDRLGSRPAQQIISQGLHFISLILLVISYCQNPSRQNRKSIKKLDWLLQWSVRWTVLPEHWSLLYQQRSD